MPDRYIKALAYRVWHGPLINYDGAEPLTHEELEFRVRVENGKATFEFTTKRFETESAALEAVRDFITRWEFLAGLQHGPHSFRLDFENAEFREKNPVSGGLQIRTTLTSPPGIVSVAVCELLPSYPKPPSETTGVKVTSNVRSMFDRYMGYRQGKERLDSMAYFCLTVLEGEACQEPGVGSRRSKAAKAYGVDRAVPNEIGRLSTEHGRRAGGNSRPLNYDERRFLKAATEAIIRRMAEKAHDRNADLPRITMRGLPRRWRPSRAALTARDLPAAGPAAPLREPTL